MSRPGRSTLQRLGLSALSLGIIIATFAFVLPTIADYREVWALVQDLSWEWIALLLAATLVNLLTFAPPWMVALPGLSFGQAITVTQVSTALSIVVPGGLAAGVATSYAMLRRWGFVAREVARAVTLTGLWNQFLNLAFPIIAVFLLNSEGGDTRLLGVVAFVGVAVLGVVVAALAVVLVSKRLANDIGELAAAVADWLLARIRRGPVSWGGPSFERFRPERRRSPQAPLARAHGWRRSRAASASSPCSSSRSGRSTSLRRRYRWRRRSPPGRSSASSGRFRSRRVGSASSRSA